jgi:hypothetical protein
MSLSFLWVDIKMNGVGSMYSLYAHGPQDTYIMDEKISPFSNSFKQYTDFSIDTTTYQFGKAPYTGTTQTLSVPMKGFPGDLLSNMFLKCKLPEGYTYIESVGRALIQSISIHLDTVELETIDDDWMIIHDEIFLDDDEKRILQRLINGTSLYIPLELFFCRRAGGKKNKHQPPYFPACACYNQVLYIKIAFATSELICGRSGCDISDVKLVTEHITLTDTERLQFLKPYTVKMNRVYKEPFNTLENGTASINLTANFKVSLMVWFLRYTLYETSVQLYSKRYSYGYITLDTFTLQNTDPFESLDILVNNKAITDRFSGSNFFTYLQPLTHGLSTPDKNIYMYSFGLTPYDGSFDFSKVDSKCTLLNMRINPELKNDITKYYNIYVYSYGQVDFKFSDGVCSKLYS